MGPYQFVFEINGRKVGTCSAISGLEEVGHKVQPGQPEYGHKIQPGQPQYGHKIQPGQPRFGDLAANPIQQKASLLIPAVQKVRTAAARNAIKLGHKVNPPAGPASAPPGARAVPSQMKILVAAPSADLKLKATPSGAPLTLQGFQPEPGAMQWVTEQGGRPQPRSGVLSLRDSRNRTVAQWNFTNAWPSKISGPQPKSDGNDVAMEELTLAFEGFRRTL